LVAARALPGSGRRRCKQRRAHDNIAAALNDRSFTFRLRRCSKFHLNKRK
jgi:hypothetical protein